MPAFLGVEAIITDIEGTTSSIAFVHEVLFPYAAEHLPVFVREHASETRVQAQLEAVNAAAGLADPSLDEQIEQLLEWIREDKKITPLKILQGYIWEAGYRNGDYRAHVFPDVAPELQRWQESGLKLYVYSSGSVLAQKLFFQYSEAGNLLPLFDGHFDTTVGGKREVNSYRAISEQVDIVAQHCLFLSDITAELEAARAAGFQVCLLERPGNGDPGSHTFPACSSFADIVVNAEP